MAFLFKLSEYLNEVISSKIFFPLWEVLYVTYFLAQLFNITIDPNYEKLPEDKRPLRPNFICTP